jgi:hypothetical protein
MKHILEVNFLNRQKSTYHLLKIMQASFKICFRSSKRASTTIRKPGRFYQNSAQFCLVPKLLKKESKGTFKLVLNSA